MKIMGMHDSSFYLSWIIHYMIVYAITSLLIAFELKTSVFPNSDFFVLFVWYYLFCLALIFQSLFVTVFFTKA